MTSKNRTAVGRGGVWMFGGIVALAVVLAAGAAHALPPFARQTGQQCAACHVGGNWPQLTPWGRWFKLTAYTAGRAFWKAEKEENVINHVPVGTFGQVGVTFAKEPRDANGSTVVTDNGEVKFNQVTIAAGTKITDFMGLFYEYGYANNFPGYSWGPGGVDLRAAHAFHPFKQELLLGITMNNQPGVQDVWNTVPLWTFPYYGSPVAPGPPASTVISNLEGQIVGGTGIYAMLNRGWYAELTTYTNPNGFYQWLAPDVNPSSLCLDRASPYWRLFWTRNWQKNVLMLGTFGINAPINAQGCSGPNDTYTDAAFDAQYQWLGEHQQFQVQTSYIHEWQDLNASYGLKQSSRTSGTLNSFNIGGTYTLRNRWSFSLAYLLNNGSDNAALYGVKDSAGNVISRSPNTNGLVAEVNYLFTQNLKLYLQYAGFFEFNGRRNDIDGMGRSASDNNTLWLSLFWAY